VEPDPSAYSVQTHDYNPGYLGGWPDGVFWTIPVSAEAVTIDAESGEARCTITDLDIPDWGNIPNAFANGPNTPGRVSFDMRFFRDESSTRYRYSSTPVERDQYEIDYWSTRATLAWTSETEGGFSFESYAIDDYPSDRSPGQFFAIVGHENNGAFRDPSGSR
jgi:hypothetical protein